MRSANPTLIWLTSLVLCLLSGCISLEKSDKIETQYKRYCFACHGTGAAGAPKTGDTVAWQPRVKKGKDALLKSVTQGMVGMPPKGRCQECTPDELRALIDKMAD